MIYSKKDRIFNAVNGFLLFAVITVVAYPLYFVLIASVSDPDMVNTGKIWLFPKGITFLAYREIFRAEKIWLGYANSFFYLTTGTLLNVSLILTAAFGLSRKKLAGRGILMGFFIITMYFNGGLIPLFLLVKNLGMIDTRAALLFPNAVNVFNLIITRTFLQSTIPEELYEASFIDGCSYARIFTQIILPLSKPIIAVIALYSAVAHWNQYFNALIFLPQAFNLHPLQMVLREILIASEQLNNATELSSLTAEEMTQLAQLAKMSETLKYALIILATIPLLVAYPFVQKYFVKGVMIGSLKG